MRVRIVVKGGYSNPRRGVELPCGEVCDLADGLALKLIRHRIAEPDPAPVLETVAVAPPENAAKRVGKPRTRKGPQ